MTRLAKKPPTIAITQHRMSRRAPMFLDLSLISSPSAPAPPAGGWLRSEKRRVSQPRRRAFHRRNFEPRRNRSTILDAGWASHGLFVYRLGRPFSGQLMSTRRFACGASQPIRLFQNVGIFRLFSRKKADHHERRAKQQAYQHNFPVGASVCAVKRTRHKSPLTQRGSAAMLAGDHFRTASQRLENGFVRSPPKHHRRRAAQTRPCAGAAR